MSVVYVLVDPRTGEIRYVGYCGNLAARLRSHVSLAELDGRSDHKSRWVLSLLGAGVRPVAVVIESYGSTNEARLGEQKCEAELRSLGCRLTNTAPTGGLSPMLNADIARKANTTAKAKRANESIAKKMASDPEYRERRILQQRRAAAKALEVYRANEKSDPQRRTDRIDRLKGGQSKSHDSVRYKIEHDHVYRERWLQRLREIGVRGRASIALSRGPKKPKPDAAAAHLLRATVLRSIAKESQIKALRALEVLRQQPGFTNHTPEGDRKQGESLRRWHASRSPEERQAQMLALQAKRWPKKELVTA